MSAFTFRKAEHLCLRRDIDALFSAGSRGFTVYPVRAVWRPAPTGEGPAVQLLLSVPKRRLRHAVDRNRAKRQLREAYRLNKALLAPLAEAGVRLHVAFVWLADKPLTTRQVQACVVRLLHHLSERALPPAANSDQP